ncbi:CRISPR-associated protein Csx20 [Leptotrichia alba]|uniref:CRISPR-associated protein Csx20 n=1 Tax=Leptotrichia alba TaxID=3239304 RepID=A0AB39V1X1_9FUSO
MKKKEKKVLLVFSHQLTENQKKELVEEYKVKEIKNLPEELQNMWSNVSIKKNYRENLEKIKKFIKENFNKDDIILIQGNWGYTYNLVKWSIENELIPVYSYTERNVEEIKEGEIVKKISYFEHVKFIKYE